MEFSISRKNASLIALWCVAAGALVSVPFWKNFFVQTLCALVVYSAVCAVLVTLRLASCRVRVGTHHITLRRGVLFLTTKRIPLRFITGCHIFATPVQRWTESCILTLYGAGTLTVLPGASLHDAEQLAVLLTQGGRVL